MYLKIALILSLVFLFISCEDEQFDQLIDPPNVVITYPTQDETVSGVVRITAMATSTVDIVKLNLWVNGVMVEGSDDTEEPYEFFWNTLELENGSRHSIVIRAYDSNDNVSDSEIRYLTVDNSGLMPDKLSLTVSYQDGNALLSWSESNENDFKEYRLYRSDNIEMENSQMVYSSDDRTDTEFLVDDLEEDETRYYQVIHSNEMDFESQSNTLKVEILDDWEYFYTINSGDDKLEKINKNGQVVESFEIDSNFAFQSRLIITDGEIYFTPNKRVLKVFKNGVTSKLLDYDKVGSGAGFHGLAFISDSLFIHVEASGPSQGYLTSFFNGLYNEIGSSSKNSSILAICEFQNLLYAYSESSNSLYQYDRDSGSIVGVGSNSGLNFVQGMDSYGDYIYAIDNSGGSSQNAKTKFYRLDLTTGENKLLFTLDGVYSGLAFEK